MSTKYEAAHALLFIVSKYILQQKYLYKHSEAMEEWIFIKWLVDEVVFFQPRSQLFIHNRLII
jgi:hypothetical protein